MGPFSVRKYDEKGDFEMIRAWNKKHNEIEPLPEMFPDTTFVVEMCGVPALSACIYLTNSKWLAHAEHFISNPELKGPARRDATRFGMTFLESYARGLGYQNIYCVTKPEALKRYYKQLGFTVTVDGAACFMKNLGTK